MQEIKSMFLHLMISSSIYRFLEDFESFLQSDLLHVVVLDLMGIASKELEQFNATQDQV